MDLIIPFKIGDAVELRSFDAGYRGAWFRCKISAMCVRYGQMECQVEYIDYPEEQRSWSRLYKVFPECRNQKAGKASCGNAGKGCIQKTESCQALPQTPRKQELRARGRKAGQNRELMLRPPFPRWCWENDIPELGQKLDVVAVVSSPWKVGDLVDWWYTDCFWTGKIVELLDDDKVKIACPEAPLGEGGCYDAALEDLRPALDWSLVKGWSAPLSQENGESWYTARLITENPDTGITSSDEDMEQSYDGIKEVQKCLNGSFDTPKLEIRKCLNGSSVAPEEKVMDSLDVKHPASTNGRCSMKSQTHSGEEAEECLSEDPDTSPDAIPPEAQVAPDEIEECCTNSQADYPTSPMANSGESYELLSNGQSGVTSFKKLKTSTEHASRIDTPAAVYSRKRTTQASVEQPPETIGEALMEVEELARKIRRAQDLLQSIEDDDDAPPGRVATPAWKFRKA